MKSICVLLLMVAASTAGPLTKWAQFKVQFNKQYSSPEEEKYRMDIFMENLLEIEEHNKKYEQGLKTFTSGINQFTDWTYSEFVRYAHCLNTTALSIEMSNWDVVQSSFLSTKALPDSVDWREKGAVTEIKNQKECGSCWAFSTTGAIEGQQFLKSNTLVSLSAQQLVDCSKENNACSGGWTWKAMDYVKKNGGIDKEDSYPYENAAGQCRYNANNVGATISGFVRVPQGDEKALQQAVAEVGPVSVSIDATKLKPYDRQIFIDEQCSTTKLTHAVLVVGYGTDPQKGDYWIIKNSWGTVWGNSGYFLMGRNRNNMCGIATMALYPTIG